MATGGDYSLTAATQVTDRTDELNSGPARVTGQQEKTEAAMKLTATIRPKETKTIEAEGEDYETVKAQLLAQVPEGWEVLQILNTP
jgi:hypothetical protein